MKPIAHRIGAVGEVGLSKELEPGEPIHVVVTRQPAGTSIATGDGTSEFIVSSTLVARQ